MTVRQSLFAQGGMLVAAALFSAVVRPSLPETAPIHWNLAGKPDAYGSPALNLWLMPGVIALMILMTVALPKLSPKRFEIDRFGPTYALAMALVSGLMFAIHLVLVATTAGLKVDVTSAMMVILGAFFAVFGLVLGKIKRNFYMGIRTPWTLANERVWEDTHRRAGPLWFYGGLAIAVLALFHTPMAILLVMLLLISLWPCVDSYLLYKRFES